MTRYTDNRDYTLSRLLYSEVYKGHTISAVLSPRGCMLVSVYHGYALAMEHVSLFNTDNILLARKWIDKTELNHEGSSEQDEKDLDT